MDFDMKPTTDQGRLTQAMKKIEGAYAPNTIRAYRVDMEEFIVYCKKRDVLALPAFPETVAAFLVSVIGTGPKSATIRRKVSSISAIHRLSNLPDPTTHSEVRIAMRKMYRQLGRNAEQAYGITQPLLEKLLAATSQNLRGMRDRALLLMAHDTLRRQSELASLRVEDLECLPENGSSVLLRRSKTDQEGTGKWLHFSERTSLSLQDWVASAPITEGLILRGVMGRGKLTGQLGDGQISRIYKRLARRAGLSELTIKTISGHSLRVGGAQDLLLQGASLPQIMVKGGWSKTDTVMRYIEKAQFRNQDIAPRVSTGICA
jgi:site-specific recombinase XerD